jgi:hypothetical protein
MSIFKLQQTNQLAMQCMGRANGLIFAVNFHNSVGVPDEIHAAARLNDIEHNKAELMAMSSDLFRLMHDADTMEHFRQAHFDMRTELPDWLKNVLSAHDAALGLVGQVEAVCHNAPLKQNTAMLKWQAITKAIRSIPQVDLLQALDAEYRYASSNLKPPYPQIIPDDSAWVKASTLWPIKFTSNKELTKFRKQHPDLFRNPSRNRLEIHAAKWAEYWATQDRKGFDTLGESTPSIADDPGASDEFIAGAVKRMADIKKKKAGKQ